MNSYTISLADEQQKRITDIVNDGTWQLKEIPYAKWSAKKNNVSVTLYSSGKLTIQGKGTDEFIEFVLEPEVTGIIDKPAEPAEPAEKESDITENHTLIPLPHAGIDESGKGDFFGPLVISAVFVEESDSSPLIDAGVKDSKLIKNAKKITETARKIKNIVQGRFATVAIGPEAYNRLYGNIRNLNKLLAWGHARVLENLLEKVPSCNMALSDKFGGSSLISNALMEKGRNIKLHQLTKAERDIAVAAASILARDEFLKRMKQLEDNFGIPLPKGASRKVEETAVEFIMTHGADNLNRIAKMHFKTADKVLAQAGRSFQN